MTEVKRCPYPLDCRAETDYGTGVTECSAKDCNMIGWLRKDGELYNTPRSDVQETIANEQG